MTTTAEAYGEKFEDFLLQHIATGNAQGLEGHLDERTVMIRAGLAQLYTGKAEIMMVLDKAMQRLREGVFQEINTQVRELSDQKFFLCSALQTDQCAMQLSLCLGEINQHKRIELIHLWEGLGGLVSEEIAARSLTALHLLQMREKERLAYQEVLEANAAVYRFVLEATSDLILDIDVAEDRIYVDRDKMMALFHVSLSENPTIREVFEQIYAAILPADQDIMLSHFVQHGKPIDDWNHSCILDMECRVMRPGKEPAWLNINMVPFCGHDGQITRVVANIKDIDHKKREEIHIKQQSQRDPLTQLVNKAYTEAGIDEFLAKEGASGALLMIDVDSFKNVNDNFGHQVGDEVLKELSQLLQQIFRSSDIIGRVGGDEFVVFMKDVSTKSSVERRAQQISEAFCRAYETPNGPVGISASIGIALTNTQGHANYAGLWPQADYALYHQKRNGKNGWIFYDDCAPPEEVTDP